MPDSTKAMAGLVLIAMLAACDNGPARLTAPPFSVGAHVARSFRPAYTTFMHVGKSGMIPIHHPPSWRVTFDTDFGLFAVSGQDWYDRAAGIESAAIDVSAIYLDRDRNGELADGEIVDYALVSVRLATDSLPIGVTR